MVGGGGGLPPSTALRLPISHWVALPAQRTYVWPYGVGSDCPKERCSPRQKSRVGRLKAKVEPLLTLGNSGFCGFPTPNMEMGSLTSMESARPPEQRY